MDVKTATQNFMNQRKTGGGDRTSLLGSADEVNISQGNALQNEASLAMNLSMNSGNLRTSTDSQNIFQMPQA